MLPDEQAASPVTDHGGNLAAARQRYPDAPEPWVDLSTGISPFPYPYSPLPATAFSRLPEPAFEARMRAITAKAYGAPSPKNVVCAGGTQILLPFVFGLKKPGRAVVLGPTYAEHRRVAALCGHDCRETETIRDLETADIAVVVNPNNPDGRIVARPDLLALGEKLAARGGLLAVDEAFMDVGPAEASLTGDVDRAPIIVLRSFGKFHGLAGVRLGFAVASPEIAGRLRDRLGPWAVSGPALEIGIEALADAAWRDRMRGELARQAARLDTLLMRRGLEIVGGAGLFRLACHGDAARLRDILGQAGLLARSFAFRSDWLRFGLPGDENSWDRLDAALAVWSDTVEGSR